MTTLAPPPIKLALVDDHLLFRQGMRALLAGKSEFEVVCEAGNGQELLECLDSGARPDVVLLDMQMPVLDGMQTTRLLRSQFPQVCVIVLSMHDDPDLIERVLAEGAHGYLSKMASAETVQHAVLTAAGR